MVLMHIPDEQWDEIVSICLKVADTPNVTSSVRMYNLIHHLINLEDSPVPRKKRATLKGFHKIKKGRLIMRKFTKYFIVRLVGEQSLKSVKESISIPLNQSN
jgi:hypothetical protein